MEVLCFDLGQVNMRLFLNLNVIKYTSLQCQLELWKKKNHMVLNLENMESGVPAMTILARNSYEGS
jgi:hypothetical protein